MAPSSQQALYILKSVPVKAVPTLSHQARQTPWEHLSWPYNFRYALTQLFGHDIDLALKLFILVPFFLIQLRLEN